LALVAFLEVFVVVVTAGVTAEVTAEVPPAGRPGWAAVLVVRCLARCSQIAVG